MQRPVRELSDLVLSSSQTGGTEFFGSVCGGLEGSFWLGDGSFQTYREGGG